MAKLINEEANKVSGGTHTHPGTGEDRTYPRKFTCQDCYSTFYISTQFDYDNLVNNYTDFYCSNCRDNHRK